MKKIVSIVALLFVAALSFGLYEYSRAPASLKNQRAEIILSATELKEQLATDTSARSRFSNKVILVEGTVSSVEQGEHTTIIIDSSIRGELEENTPVPGLGQTVRLKGMLGGYDEIFEEVVLVKCQLEE
jgi:starvation-inducible outer membrane lipoprotein